MGALVFLVLGLVCVFVPFLVTPFPVPQWLMLILGLGFVLVALMMTAMKLYRKTAANEALVKTGAGGASVVLDGGTLVVPVLHQVVPVSLETMKLEVERQGGGRACSPTRPPHPPPPPPPPRRHRPFPPPHPPQPHPRAPRPPPPRDRRPVARPGRPSGP